MIKTGLGGEIERSGQMAIKALQQSLANNNTEQHRTEISIKVKIQERQNEPTDNASIIIDKQVFRFSFRSKERPGKTYRGGWREV